MNTTHKPVSLKEELAKMAREDSFAKVNQTASLGFTLKADVSETPREYMIYIDLPGVDEDEIQIAWDEGTLFVSGDRDFDHDNQDAEQFLRLERLFGRYEYRICFEAPIMPLSISAKYKRGVLRIRVPKVLGGSLHEPHPSVFDLPTVNMPASQCDGSCESCQNKGASRPVGDSRT